VAYLAAHSLSHDGLIFLEPSITQRRRFLHDDFRPFHPSRCSPLRSPSASSVATVPLPSGSPTTNTVASPLTNDDLVHGRTTRIFPLSRSAGVVVARNWGHTTDVGSCFDRNNGADYSLARSSLAKDGGDRYVGVPCPVAYTLMMTRFIWLGHCITNFSGRISVLLSRNMESSPPAAGGGRMIVGRPSIILCLETYLSVRC
jgi:hypothetical protein